MKFVAKQLYSLTCNNFRSKAIKLPTDWKQPQGDPEGKQYGDAFKPGEKSVPIPPMQLFQAASANKYHVDTQKRLHSDFDKYIDGITGAICSALGTWQDASTFTVGIINASTCTVPPGSLQGPPIGPLILASGAPMATPQEIKYSNAIANALGIAWQAWHMGVSGMLTYPPTFSFMTAPMHPPTPNVPAPISGLPSMAEGLMSGAMLKNAMVGQLADPQALHHMDLFDALGNAINSVFSTWKTSTMCTKIMGTGPIPTFAPPYVPGGPVVGGVIVPAPGNLV